MDFFSSKRIWIDIETKEVLYNLARIYTNRDDLYNSMLCEWISIEGKKCERGYGFKNGIIYPGYKVSRIFLNIEDGIWNDFLGICFKRELDVSTGFKTALFGFVGRLDY